MLGKLNIVVVRHIWVVLRYFVISTPIGIESIIPEKVKMDIRSPACDPLVIFRSAIILDKTGATLFIQIAPATMEINITTKIVHGDFFLVFLLIIFSSPPESV